METIIAISHNTPIEAYGAKPCHINYTTEWLDYHSHKHQWTTWQPIWTPQQMQSHHKLSTSEGLLLERPIWNLDSQLPLFSKQLLIQEVTPSHPTLINIWPRVLANYTHPIPKGLHTGRQYKGFHTHLIDSYFATTILDGNTLLMVNIPLQPPMTTPSQVGYSMHLPFHPSCLWPGILLIEASKPTSPSQIT